MEISREFINFVQEHASDDINALRLKYSGKAKNNIGFDPDFALVQIEARRKTQKKIPVFLVHDDFIFPSLLAAEQASNHAVAGFHASLISSCQSVLDLTAGLGIDDITFANNGINVTACEIDEIKCDVLRHNASVMGVEDNLKVVNADSVKFLQCHSTSYDAIFADPARRNSAGAKVHALADCQPDILNALPDIMKISNRLIVKCSPLLDLTLIRRTVSNLAHIYVVCFKGECKEVLIDIVNGAEFSGVSVLDLDFDTVLSSFHTYFSSDCNNAALKYAVSQSPIDYQYLYEPNSGVMKTGDWYALQKAYPDLMKADVNTHIFLSDTLYADFPGRVFKVSALPDKKGVKALKNEKLNVVSRNHPLSAPQIYSKYGIIPGADSFLYAFRYKGKPIMLLCDRISQISE